MATAFLRPRYGKPAGTVARVSHQSRWSRPGILICLALLAFYSIAPLWWLVVSVTKSRVELYNTNGLWFGAENHVVENFRQLFTYENGIFFRWMGNSILYAGVGAIVCTVISLAAGYSLSKFDFPGKKIEMALVMASFLVPTALLTLPLYLLFAGLHLTDTVWAVLIPSFVNAFDVYLAKEYIDGTVPDELLEAARVDGAGELLIFRKIVLPMLSTPAATIFILTFVLQWNNFYLPITMLRGSDKWTLALGLYSFMQTKQSSVFDPTTIALAGSVVSIIPLAVVMMLMQRFWRSGVALGAVKG
ncbi:carbohydrate ABC transporter permease [Bifidobacterium miconisargentati]|uniref:carbohydrate ABC transporter permease n=1 Tax=Bifidobacterium miconisargentati TaxID=2834437 RepID=UPI001BDD8665|nr:carbohydrate ABC transporter permease [Bifidobacterium miconisargentati]MBW3090551.1 carbohydrate ABC transporter permease [Bifidobacterium miconisargentati]